jgi:hypothetical protein
MTNTDWIDETADTYPDAMLRMNGYDDCVAGVVQIFGGQPVFLYDREKVILRLMEDGMDREEAEEFHEFNQAGACLGEGTPAFLLEWAPRQPAATPDTTIQ